MVCPKCRLEQADAAECARCGVFVARHRTRPDAVPPPRVAERPADAAEAGHGGFRQQARRLAPVLAIGVLFAWAYRTTFTAAPPAAPPPHASRTPAAVPVLATAVTLPEPQPEPVATVAEVRAEPVAPPVEESFPTAACPVAAQGASRGGVSSSWYTEASFTQASDEQAAVSAPMVIYVYTDWCPYCREFERDLLNTRAMDTYLRENVVKVRVNPETSAGAQALANELGVRGFPSFFVMTPGGQPDKMGLRVNGRLRPPSDFIADIDGRMKQQAGALVAEGLRLQQQGKVAEATDAGRGDPHAARRRRSLPCHARDARAGAAVGRGGGVLDELPRAQPVARAGLPRARERARPPRDARPEPGRHPEGLRARRNESLLVTGESKPRMRLRGAEDKDRTDVLRQRPV